MKLEYRIWNIKPEWTPLESTTMDEAAKELNRMLPYSEEAQVRNADTGEVFKFHPPKEEIHWGP